MSLEKPSLIFDDAAEKGLKNFESNKSKLEAGQQERFNILMSVLERYWSDVFTKERIDQLKSQASSVVSILPLVGNYKLAVEAIIGKTAAGYTLKPHERGIFVFSVVTACLSAVLATEATQTGDWVPAVLANVSAVVMLGEVKEQNDALRAAMRAGKAKLAAFLSVANRVTRSLPPNVVKSLNVFLQEFGRI